MAEREKGKRRSTSPHEGGYKEKKRIKLSSNDIRELNRDKLISKWREQESYIDHLLSKLEASGAQEVAKLKDSEAKLTLQVQELTRRENVLNMRLATKQQEMQDLMSQVHDLKQSQSSEGAQLHSMIVDPAVNMVFEKMKAQLLDYKEKLDQAQNDLSAWKFTPDSVTGKKLMARCRNLIQENAELGKQISQGRVAQLEAEVSLQTKYNQEIKAALDDLSEFIVQVDEEVEAMQSTILQLQHQLKEARTPGVGGGAVKDRTNRPNGPVETGSSNSSSSDKSGQRSQH